ncbi:MAG TPA: hypothetical protein VLL54_12095 [Pyrinomonadaceae bacterium]|nr:hypothetical protein [Pyrinomonadaceae bacterium]
MHPATYSALKLLIDGAGNQLGDWPCSRGHYPQKSRDARPYLADVNPTPPGD